MPGLAAKTAGGIEGLRGSARGCGRDGSKLPPAQSGRKHRTSRQVELLLRASSASQIEEDRVMLGGGCVWWAASPASIADDLDVLIAGGNNQPKTDCGQEPGEEAQEYEVIERQSACHPAKLVLEQLDAPGGSNAQSLLLRHPAAVHVDGLGGGAKGELADGHSRLVLPLVLEVQHAVIARRGFDGFREFQTT